MRWLGEVSVGSQQLAAHADCVRGRWFVTVVLPYSGRYVNLGQMKRVRQDVERLICPVQDVRFCGREERKYGKRRP